MELGDAVLTLTVDDSGLVSGFARAKGDTEEFTNKTKEQSGNFKDMWEGAFNALRTAGVLLALFTPTSVRVAGFASWMIFAARSRISSN